MADPRWPYEYTTGRWLKRDRLQRESRYVAFDFAALRQKAVELCPRARNMASCRKLEGGFNKAFLFTMDSGERIVARIPTNIAGPRWLTTNSEVATMTYSKASCLPFEMSILLIFGVTSTIQNNNTSAKHP